MMTDMDEVNIGLPYELAMTHDESRREFYASAQAMLAALNQVRSDHTALSFRCLAAERDRDEADRRAGAAERLAAPTEEKYASLVAWRDRQKAEAGYDRSVSFDTVWAETLEKARKYDRMQAATTDRAKFDAWITSLNVGYNIAFRGEYNDGDVQGLWLCWQAAMANSGDLELDLDKLKVYSAHQERRVEALTATHVLYTWLRKKCDEPSNDVVAVHMNIGHDWAKVTDLDRDLRSMIEREEP